MKNSYANKLYERKLRDFEMCQNGAVYMSYITLIAIENILPPYVDEELLPKIYNDIESEMTRVWAEGEDYMRKGNFEDLELSLKHYVKEIRIKRGMSLVDEK